MHAELNTAITAVIVTRDDDPANASSAVQLSQVQASKIKAVQIVGFSAREQPPASGPRPSPD